MLNNLKPIHKGKQKKRVGRGGKRGTYSGRGCKGQKSRSGSNKEPMIRGWIKKYPKLRGYRFNPITRDYLEVNLNVLEDNFEKNSRINPGVLSANGIIGRIEKRIPKVKILGKGVINKSFVIEDCDISKAAKEKIEKAGGSVKDLKQKTKTKIKTKNKN